MDEARAKEGGELRYLLSMQDSSGAFHMRGELHWWFRRQEALRQQLREWKWRCWARGPAEPGSSTSFWTEQIVETLTGLCLLASQFGDAHSQWVQAAVRAQGYLAATPGVKPAELRELLGELGRTVVCDQRFVLPEEEALIELEVEGRRMVRTTEGWYDTNGNRLPVALAERAEQALRSDPSLEREFEWDSFLDDETEDQVQLAEVMEAHGWSPKRLSPRQRERYACSLCNEVLRDHQQPVYRMELEVPTVTAEGKLDRPMKFYCCLNCAERCVNEGREWMLQAKHFLDGMHGEEE